MRRSLSPAILIGLLLIGSAVAGGAILSTRNDKPSSHADGEGDLAFTGSPDAWSAEVTDPQGKTEFTYGIDVCDQTGAGPIVLTSVAPTAYVGSGATLIGAQSFDRLPNADGIMETEGYPPAEIPADRLRELAGTKVSFRCDGAGWTEILIGLRANGTEGGGWRGVNVNYTVGGRSRSLLANEYLVICGSNLRCHADMVTRDMPASKGP